MSTRLPRPHSLNDRLKTSSRQRHDHDNLLKICLILSKEIQHQHLVLEGTRHLEGRLASGKFQHSATQVELVVKLSGDSDGRSVSHLLPRVPKR